MMSCLLTLIVSMWVSLAVLNMTSVQSSGVFLSLKEMNYTANNSFILITEIENYYYGGASLQCITDRRPCCASPPDRHGEWFFPNGERVPAYVNATTFYRNRGNDGTVILSRLYDVIMPTGKFCCVVPDATNTNVTLCINIVLELPVVSTAAPPVEVTIDFNLTSSQDSIDVTFSLTCTASDGPVGNVTWTRDELLLDNNGPLVLTNTSIVSYTNVLYVNSRIPGTYNCQVRGFDNQVLSALDFTVYAAPVPLYVQTTQTSNAEPVEVSWRAPSRSSSEMITGYRIFYGEGKSILVPSYVTRILIDIQDQDLESVSIHSESTQLPSELIEAVITDGRMPMMSSLSCSTQVGTAVGVVLLLVALLAVTIVSTLISIFCWWRKKSQSTQSRSNFKDEHGFSKSANMAYGEVKSGYEEGGEGDLYEDPENIVDDSPDIYD